MEAALASRPLREDWTLSSLRRTTQGAMIGFDLARLLQGHCRIRESSGVSAEPGRLLRYLVKVHNMIVPARSGCVSNHDQIPLRAPIPWIQSGMVVHRMTSMRKLALLPLVAGNDELLWIVLVLLPVDVGVSMRGCAEGGRASKQCHKRFHLVSKRGTFTQVQRFLVLLQRHT